MDKEQLIKKLLHIDPTLYQDVLEDFSEDTLEKAYTALLEERSQDIRQFKIEVF